MSAIRSMIIRSRSHRVVQDGSAAAPEVDEWHEEDTSCWANMPEELLREVLLRIEASESSWPPRKSVVACAGVCRTWRQITKELVKVPEVSGRLTFPISVKQVPRLPFIRLRVVCKIGLLLNYKGNLNSEKLLFYWFFSS